MTGATLVIAREISFYLIYANVLETLTRDASIQRVARIANVGTPLRAALELISSAIE